MSEDKATRWRRMSREQRERLMSALCLGAICEYDLSDLDALEPRCGSGRD